MSRGFREGQTENVQEGLSSGKLLYLLASFKKNK